jgi:hypothetical protein
MDRRDPPPEPDWRSIQAEVDAWTAQRLAEVPAPAAPRPPDG